MRIAKANDQDAYDSYVVYCGRVGVKARDIDEWRKLSKVVPLESPMTLDLHVRRMSGSKGLWWIPVIK